MAVLPSSCYINKRTRYSRMHHPTSATLWYLQPLRNYPLFSWESVPSFFVADEYLPYRDVFLFQSNPVLPH